MGLVRVDLSEIYTHYEDHVGKFRNIHKNKRQEMLQEQDTSDEKTHHNSVK